MIPRERRGRSAWGFLQRYKDGEERPAAPPVSLVENHILLGRGAEPPAGAAQALTGAARSNQWLPTDDDRVSRLHASITAHWDAGCWQPIVTIQDHSRNGTFLNGAPLPSGQPLALTHGDRISLVISVNPLSEVSYIFEEATPLPGVAAFAAANRSCFPASAANADTDAAATSDAPANFTAAAAAALAAGPFSPNSPNAPCTTTSTRGLTFDGSSSVGSVGDAANTVQGVDEAMASPPHSPPSVSAPRSPDRRHLARRRSVSGGGFAGIRRRPRRTTPQPEPLRSPFAASPRAGALASRSYYVSDNDGDRSDESDISPTITPRSRTPSSVPISMRSFSSAAAVASAYLPFAGSGGASGGGSSSGNSSVVRRNGSSSAARRRPSPPSVNNARVGGQHRLARQTNSPPMSHGSSDDAFSMSNSQPSATSRTSLDQDQPISQFQNRFAMAQRRNNEGNVSNFNFSPRRLAGALAPAPSPASSAASTPRSPRATAWPGSPMRSQQARIHSPASSFASSHGSAQGPHSPSRGSSGTRPRRLSRLLNVSTPESQPPGFPASASAAVSAGACGVHVPPSAPASPAVAQRSTVAAAAVPIGVGGGEISAGTAATAAALTVGAAVQRLQAMVSIGGRVPVTSGWQCGVRKPTGAEKIDRGAGSEAENDGSKDSDEDFSFLPSPPPSRPSPSPVPSMASSNSLSSLGLVSCGPATTAVAAAQSPLHARAVTCRMEETVRATTASNPNASLSSSVNSPTYGPRCGLGNSSNDINCDNGYGYSHNSGTRSRLGPYGDQHGLMAVYGGGYNSNGMNAACSRDRNAATVVSSPVASAFQHPLQEQQQQLVSDGPTRGSQSQQQLQEHSTDLAASVASAVGTSGFGDGAGSHDSISSSRAGGWTGDTSLSCGASPLQRQFSPDRQRLLEHLVRSRHPNRRRTRYGECLDTPSPYSAASTPQWPRPSDWVLTPGRVAAAAAAATAATTTASDRVGESSGTFGSECSGSAGRRSGGGVGGRSGPLYDTAAAANTSLTRTVTSSCRVAATGNSEGAASADGGRSDEVSYGSHTCPSMPYTPTSLVKHLNSRLGPMALTAAAAVASTRYGGAGGGESDANAPLPSSDQDSTASVGCGAEDGSSGGGDGGDDDLAYDDGSPLSSGIVSRECSWIVDAEGRAPGAAMAAAAAVQALGPRGFGGGAVDASRGDGGGGASAPSSSQLRRPAAVTSPLPPPPYGTPHGDWRLQHLQRHHWQPSDNGGSTGLGSLEAHGFVELDAGMSPVGCPANRVAAGSDGTGSAVQTLPPAHQLPPLLARNRADSWGGNGAPSVFAAAIDVELQDDDLDQLDPNATADCVDPTLPDAALPEAVSLAHGLGGMVPSPDRQQSAAPQALPPAHALATPALRLQVITATSQPNGRTTTIGSGSESSDLAPPTSRYPANSGLEELQCGLCQGYLQRAVAVQPCGHTFCADCLSEHLSHAMTSGDRLRCPERCGTFEQVSMNLPARRLVFMVIGGGIDSGITTISAATADAGTPFAAATAAPPTPDNGLHSPPRAPTPLGRHLPLTSPGHHSTGSLPRSGRVSSDPGPSPSNARHGQQQQQQQRDSGHGLAGQASGQHPTRENGPAGSISGSSSNNTVVHADTEVSRRRTLCALPDEDLPISAVRLHVNQAEELLIRLREILESKPGVEAETSTAGRTANPASAPCAHQMPRQPGDNERRSSSESWCGASDDVAVRSGGVNGCHPCSREERQQQLQQEEGQQGQQELSKQQLQQQLRQMEKEELRLQRLAATVTATSGSCLVLLGALTRLACKHPEIREALVSMGAFQGCLLALEQQHRLQIQLEHSVLRFQQRLKQALSAATGHTSATAAKASSSGAVAEAFNESMAVQRSVCALLVGLLSTSSEQGDGGFNSNSNNKQQQQQAQQANQWALARIGGTEVLLGVLQRSLEMATTAEEAVREQGQQQQEQQHGEFGEQDLGRDVHMARAPEEAGEGGGGQSERGAGVELVAIAALAVLRQMVIGNTMTQAHVACEAKGAVLGMLRNLPYSVAVQTAAFRLLAEMVRGRDAMHAALRQCLLEEGVLGCVVTALRGQQEDSSPSCDPQLQGGQPRRDQLDQEGSGKHVDMAAQWRFRSRFFCGRYSSGRLSVPSSLMQQRCQAAAAEGGRGPLLCSSLELLGELMDGSMPPAMRRFAARELKRAGVLPLLRLCLRDVETEHFPTTRFGGDDGSSSRGSNCMLHRRSELPAAEDQVLLAGRSLEARMSSLLFSLHWWKVEGAAGSGAADTGKGCGNGSAAGSGAADAGKGCGSGSGGGSCRTGGQEEQKWAKWQPWKVAVAAAGAGFAMGAAVAAAVAGVVMG